MPDKPISEKNYSHRAVVEDLQARVGSGYPAPLHEPCAKRSKTALGDPVGLSQFGVNLMVLQPGAWSGQRHWHQEEDEFVYVVEGEVTLVTNEGETVLSAGEVAGFPAGQENGHHLINKSQLVVQIFEVGTRALSDTVEYPDVDMKARSEDGNYRFLHKNDEPYE